MLDFVCEMLHNSAYQSQGQNNYICKQAVGFVTGMDLNDVEKV